MPEFNAARHNWNKRLINLHRKSIDLTGVDLASPIILFKPPVPKDFIPLFAVVKIRKVVNVTTAPHILIDNGTDGNNMVANVALGTTPGTYQVLTLVGNFLYNQVAPMRLKIPTLAAPTTGVATFLVDIEIIGIYY